MAAIAATAGSEHVYNIGSGRMLYTAKILPATDGDTFTCAPITTIESVMGCFADGAAVAADSFALTHATNVVTVETAGTVRTLQVWVIGTPDTN